MVLGKARRAGFAGWVAGWTGSDSAQCLSPCQHGIHATMIVTEDVVFGRKRVARTGAVSPLSEVEADIVARRIGEILLDTEVPLGRLDRGLPE